MVEIPPLPVMPKRIVEYRVVESATISPESYLRFILGRKKTAFAFQKHPYSDIILVAYSTVDR
jgi:hypothetical protein